MAGIISGLVMGFSIPNIFSVHEDIVKVRFSLITIAAMMAVGFMTRYAGLDATMGLAFARTGHLYPFFGTLLGWLGVALTGSDTSSNVLFGSLQKITAQQVGVSPMSDVGGQQFRRCDGQDDRRAKHRGRQHRYRMVRTRGRHLALRLLPQYCAGVPGGNPGVPDGVRRAIHAFRGAVKSGIFGAPS